MIYLLDSNVISDLMEARPKVLGRLSVVSAADQVATNVIVRGEICYGLEHLPAGKRRAGLMLEAVRVFAAIPMLPMLEAVAEEYGRLRERQNSIGFVVAENDLWIAATAIVHGATIVSRDKDMTRIAGLKVEDWSI